MTECVSGIVLNARQPHDYDLNTLRTFSGEEKMSPCPYRIKLDNVALSRGASVALHAQQSGPNVACVAPMGHLGLGEETTKQGRTRATLGYIHSMKSCIWDSF